MLALTPQGVLPPYTGTTGTGVPNGFSPHIFTPEEFVTLFGTTGNRKLILKGFFQYRKELRAFGVVGSQWIGGSFIEDCQKLRGREPNDIDVVTLVDDASVPQPGHPKHTEFRTFISTPHRHVLKTKYRCDAFLMKTAIVNPAGGPGSVVATTSDVTYWCNLFGHSRSIGGAQPLWKGMAEIPLLTDLDDQRAVNLLRKKPKKKKKGGVL